MKLTANNVIMFVAFSDRQIFNNLSKKRKFYAQAPPEAVWVWGKEDSLAFRPSSLAVLISSFISLGQ